MFNNTRPARILFFLKFWNFYFKKAFSPKKIDFFQNHEIDTLLKSYVDYYCKLLPNEYVLKCNLKDISLLKKEGYAYDFFRCISDFPINLRCNYLWGDVTHVPNEPTFVKSRPICINNDNSVLLPLDTRRHLFFPDDLIDYDDKKNFAVWRGSAFQDQRQLFLKALKTLKFCDVSHYSSKGNFKDMTSNYMSIQNQLKNKIIFSIEGNDVATNLKWIMGSNSLCFSPKLRFETWFREGQLIPFVHYVQINNDFSDVEDKFNYYISHPNEAKAIIKNAQAHAKLFYDINTQYKIAALVALKYFKSTLQIIK